MRSVPRHLFVPGGARVDAYADSPLPIGLGQTISQPYMVALMTSLLEVDVRSRVLEIGAGSGYQTAVLAEVAGEVFAIERLAPLAERARATLARLGYANVRLAIGDGARGWHEQAPFHGILVAAAAGRGAAGAARPARRRRPARRARRPRPRRSGAHHRRARRRVVQGDARHALPLRAAGARREPGRAAQGRRCAGAAPTRTGRRPAARTPAATACTRGRRPT